MKHLGTHLPSTLCVSAQLTNLATIRQFVAETAASLHAEPAAIDDMIQATDELATNMIVHGYRGQPGNIEIAVWKEGDSLAVRLRDQAPPFDPATVTPPNLALPLERRRPGGLGIYLSRRFTDSMIHRITPDGGNELTLLKKAY